MRNVLLLVAVLFLGSCREKFEVTYYPDGTVKSRRQVTKGIADGEFLTYFPTGNIETKGEWRNGEGNGYQEKYFENGKLKQSASYLNGKLNGGVLVYHDNGVIRLSAIFSEGKKIGRYAIYDREGSISEIQIFDNDGKLYYLAKLDSNGSKRLELLFPIFSFKLLGDSVEITTRSPIHFNGEARVIIGTKVEPLVMDFIVGDFVLHDTIAVSTMVSSSVSLRKLRYAFEFTPALGDTISRLLYDRELLQDSNDGETVPPEIDES